MRFPCKITNDVCIMYSTKFLFLAPSCVELLVQLASILTLVFYSCKGFVEKTHHFTLLDGEMVIDTVPDSQKQERRYLIYDLMAVNQVSVIEVRYPILLEDGITQFHFFFRFLFLEIPCRNRDNIFASGTVV